MGRGLEIFSARQKTPFVPGESTTRDKRGFCPGWWLHPGQKAPHITSFFALPLTLGFSSICAWCRRRPLLPPPREPSTAAAIDVAAAQSPDQPTGDPPERRRRRNALAGAAIPCSPSTRRYRPSQPTPRLPKGRARSPESPRHLPPRPRRACSPESAERRRGCRCERPGTRLHRFRSFQGVPARFQGLFIKLPLSFVLNPVNFENR